MKKKLANRPQVTPEVIAQLAAPEPETGTAPSLPAIVADAFGRINLRLRARMLGRLLASVGPLALTVIGGGAFAKYVAQARWPVIPVSVQDAARATSTQVQEIVRYVQQSNPQQLTQLLDALTRDPVMIAALGASVAALTIRRMADSVQSRTPR